MVDITQTYWYKKAKELEGAGETTEAQRYRIRRPSGPGSTEFGTFAPLAIAEEPIQEPIEKPKESEDPFVIRYGTKIDEEEEYYEGLDITAPTEEEELSIRERIRKQMQSYIDAINKVYAGLIGREEQEGVERLGQTRALISRAGLLGGPRGLAQQEKTKQYTQAEIKVLEDERGMRVAQVLGKIDERAEAEIQLRKTEAAEASEKYIEYLKGNREEAKNDASMLAQSGISLERLKLAMREGGKEGEIYEQLLEETGWSELQFDSMYNLSLPKEDQVDWQYQIVKGAGGKNKIVAYGMDPTTGTLKQHSYDLDFEIPEDDKEWNLMMTPNGTPLFWTKEGDIQIPTGFREGQFAKPKEGDDVDLGDVRGLRNDYFKQSGDFIKVRDAHARIQASAEDPSAAGDLALIFNYMKVLDPGSTVREGEFATAASSGSVPQRIWAQYNKVLQGERLSPEMRDDFVDRSDRLYAAQFKQQERLQKDFQEFAEDYGIDPNRVAPNLWDVEKTEFSEEDITSMKEQLNEGEILVQEKASGDVGAILETEFDETLYERL